MVDKWRNPLEDCIISPSIHTLVSLLALKQTKSGWDGHGRESLWVGPCLSSIKYCVYVNRHSLFCFNHSRILIIVHRVNNQEKDRVLFVAFEDYRISYVCCWSLFFGDRHPKDSKYHCGGWNLSLRNNVKHYPWSYFSFSIYIYIYIYIYSSSPFIINLFLNFGFTLIFHININYF